MASRKKRWPIVVGVLLVAGGVVVAIVAGLAVAATFFFRDRVTVARDISASDAAAAFTARLAEFPDARPILVLDARRQPAWAPGVDARQRSGAIGSLHALVWDTDQQELVTLSVPMWLLRRQSGPIDFGEFGDLGRDGVHLEVRDLDRFGPGVVLDFATPDGKRVLLTAQ